MNRYLIFALILLISPNGKAMIVDNLENPDAREWAYFTDTVMGGVSTGQLQYLDKDGEKFYRMTGIVSTENNGGFIQFATRIKDITDDYDGIKIRVRGNNGKLSNPFKNSLHTCTMAILFSRICS